MGITTKTVTVQEIICDCCHAKVEKYFDGRYQHDMGGEPDKEQHATLNLEFVRVWGGKQIICYSCAADILYDISEKFNEMF